VRLVLLKHQSVHHPPTMLTCTGRRTTEEHRLASTHGTSYHSAIGRAVLVDDVMCSCRIERLTNNTVVRSSHQAFARRVGNGPMHTPAASG